MTDAEIRKDMVTAGKRLEAEGLNRGASGNISVRRGDRMLTTPTAVGHDTIAARQGFENYGVLTRGTA